MIAEVIYSKYWSVFYKKNLWGYTFGAIYKKYTSCINFIAWATGGMLFVTIMLILDLIFPIVTFGLVSVIFLQIIIVMHLFFMGIHTAFNHFLNKKRWDDSNFFKYLYITIPILIAIIVSTVLSNLSFIIYLISFGIAAFIAEYFYGKILEYLFGQKFWIYNYATIDNNSTSPYNIGGAIVAGVLFSYILFYI